MNDVEKSIENCFNNLDKNTKERDYLKLSEKIKLEIDEGNLGFP